MKTAFLVRRAAPEDADQVRFLFRDTVRFINSKDYSSEQVMAWSDFYKDAALWRRKISNQHFFVACFEEKIVGFSSIENNGYLDFFYVHKDFQSKGIATKLLEEIEDRARKLNLVEIYSHVSITAKPFFLRKSFRQEGEQVNKVCEVIFVNSIMKKKISLA